MAVTTVVNDTRVDECGFFFFFNSVNYVLFYTIFIYLLTSRSSRGVSVM